MKTKRHSFSTTARFFLLTVLTIFLSGSMFMTQAQNFREYKGKVIDSENGQPLVFATLSIEGTNIASVTNSEGQFSLKVPENMTTKKILVSYIGYNNKVMPINELNPDKNKIKLEVLTVSLTEINVFPKDPYLLIQAVLNRRKENYMQDASLMTAFYRETIKKRRSYASLSEAVVQVYKQPYANERDDAIRMFKGRKSADYNKLDTLLFKLQGGPYSTLMMDIMKNPYMIISYEMLDYYNFKIENVTRIDDRMIYVLGFEQKPHIKEPLYYGKLYIDTESMAITSASYNLNVEDKSEASRMFIKKKPAGARVYPTEAAYLINYREKDGKWYYGYSRGEITFKVKWKKRLFNTIYSTQIEMAVTDWEKTETKPFKGADRMKMNIVMTDTEMGFADGDFWGSYNVIEPEKSIESAIKKIQKNLEKLQQ
ncbi:carboxypeptidase-like regulatory domain-containing protein [Marinilabiliaceae bacterium JC017]|nr:carboxypeptidase-like regulatory domain-containing protein [Marinilabiliaceae bacterium JC017]